MLRLIEERLKARQRGEAVRLEVSAGGSEELLKMLVEDEELRSAKPGQPNAYDEVYRIDGNRTVEIYRCVEFPAKWRREKVLIDGLWCADATLTHDAGRWWMFVNTAAEGAEIHDELHLFSAPRLLGEWKPHPRNPVKSDIRSARPAGNLYREGEALYRPAQICAPIYGAGVSLQRVTRLTPHEYAETEERRIAPAPGAPFLGIHTLNRAGDLSVTDFFARRPRF